MRRKCCKYVFLLNVVLFVSLFIVLKVFESKDEQIYYGVNVTSPLIYAESVTADFCRSAGAAVLVDAKSGAVLFSKNSGKRYPMASTTKIMTALAVIENSNPDDVVEVSDHAAGVEGSSIYLTKGEKLSVRDLLYGLMLESGNDAATALAEGVFGTEEKCIECMNNLSHKMGLVNTNFENVHGLDSENHYTTAYELALITKYAMENEFFKEIVGTQSYVTTGEKIRYFSNHNRLLSGNMGVIGVKTGYTSKSGRCLVSASESDGECYIAVTLNDPDDWKDHKQMLLFAHDNFEGYEIADKETFRLRIGFDEYAPKESVYITTADKAEFSLCYRVLLDEKGGRVEYSSENMSLGVFELEKIIPR